jgi:hypothetical protein
MFCSQIGSELPSSAKSTVKKSLKRRGFLQIWSQAAELLEDIQSQRFLWKNIPCGRLRARGTWRGVCQMRARMTHLRYSLTPRYIYFIEVQEQRMHGSSLGQAPCPSGGSR